MSQKEDMSGIKRAYGNRKHGAALDKRNVKTHLSFILLYNVSQNGQTGFVTHLLTTATMTFQLLHVVVLLPYFNMGPTCGSAQIQAVLKFYPHFS
jgi:hypothetical protein